MPCIEQILRITTPQIASLQKSWHCPRCSKGERPARRFSCSTVGLDATISGGFPMLRLRGTHTPAARGSRAQRAAARRPPPHAAAPARAQGLPPYPTTQATCVLQRTLHRKIMPASLCLTQLGANPCTARNRPHLKGIQPQASRATWDDTLNLPNKTSPSPSRSPALHAVPLAERPATVLPRTQLT